MIITTSNSKLATASVIELPIGLEIIVNTDKNLILSLHGSEHNAETGLLSRFWIFANEEHSNKEVKITLIPENIGDEVLIKGIESFGHDRGQFYFLLISPNLLTNRVVLATTNMLENNNVL
jgi:hypothetical protein